MKKLIVTLSLILCTSYGFTQNKNVSKEEKTTVRTIKDSQGEQKIVKKKKFKKFKTLNLKTMEKTP